VNRQKGREEKRMRGRVRLRGKRAKGGTFERKYNAERQGVEQGGQGRETRGREEDSGKERQK
jgi:hypothetical protein